MNTPTSINNQSTPTNSTISNPTNSSATPNSDATTSSGVVSAGGANYNNANTVEPSPTTVASTTMFVDDGQSKTQIVRPTTLDESMAIQKTDDNSIPTFLAKPVDIGEFDFTSSDARNSILLSIDPHTLLTSKQIWSRKIAGYNLMRGTFVLKLMINSQPFQAGRLIINYLPHYAEFSSYSQTYSRIHEFNIASATQTPNVEVDISAGTASIEIPWIAPNLWYSRDEPYTWGRIFVRVLSPIKSQSSTSAHVTAYGFWKDFELAAPIYTPEMNVIKDVWETTKRERSSTKQSGVVTTFFDFIAKPLKALSSVPLIGEAAGLGATVAKTVGDFTSYFGWSKPYNNSIYPYVSRNNAFRFYNFNSNCVADSLAMDAMNQVAPMTHFAGSDVDEMSFSYLKGIPSLINTFTLTTTDATNALKYSLPIRLENMGYNASLGSNTSTVLAPFAYVARHLRYWRGGIVITLKFVKTTFHSGRLAVTYTPSSNNASWPATAEQRSYVYRDFIDLRESNTFSFTLPYMHPAPYLETFSTGGHSPVQLAGIFQINVVNELVASSTVSSEIECLVYAAAADDFQVNAVGPVSDYCFAPEMNTDIPRISGNVGDAPTTKLTLAPATLCIGEVFTSLKQLLVMPRPTYSNGALIKPLPAPYNGYSGYRFLPFYADINTYDGDTELLKTQFPGGDYISEFSTGYVYSRGGIRITHPESVSASGSYAWTTTQDFTATSGDASELPLDISGTLSIVPVTTSQCFGPMALRGGGANGLDVVVPHYGQTPMRLNYTTQRNVSVATPETPDSPDTFLNVAMPNNSVVPPSTSGGAIFRTPHRSGADDFALGYFIGFPPVFLHRKQPEV